MTQIRLPDPADPGPARTDTDPAHADTVPPRADSDLARADSDPAAGEPNSAAPGGLILVVREEPAGTIIAVRGELDMLSARRPKAELDSVMGARQRHIAVDLTWTTFMDSAGVHALVDANQRADGKLAVICGEGPVRQVIELLGLIEVLNVAASLDEYRARRAEA